MQAPQRRLSLARVLPNMMTVGALCAGVTAIRFAIEGQFKAALLLILLAAIMDGLDGRLARLLKSESKIGAELDSLCDFVNFGVAPGLILWLWALQDMRAAGWIAVLIYVVSCLLRLARFNLGNKELDSDLAKALGAAAEKRSGFQGVPSPAGAMLAFLPMFAAFAVGESQPFHGGVIAVYMAVVGALMIGRFHTPSFKKISLQARHVRYFFVAFAALLAALLAYPWATLVGLDLVYVVVIIASLLRRRTDPDPEPPEEDLPDGA